MTVGFLVDSRKVVSRDTASLAIDLSWFSGTKGSCMAGPVWGSHSPNQRTGRLVGPGLAVDCVECFFQRPGDG